MAVYHPAAIELLRAAVPPPRVCCRPLTCGYRNEEPFVCNACERRCCWCFGCADEAPGICDDCYVRFFGEDADA